MLMLGLGLGMVMQVLVLAVQNAVPYDMLGVATSGATLFRSIGGSLGTAMLGAIFSARLAAEVAAGDGQNTAFTDSLHVVFLVAAAIMAVAFVLTWLIPEKPLRKTVETGVGDALGGPVDTDSVRELTRALSRAAGRERTLAFMAGWSSARASSSPPAPPGRCCASARPSPVRSRSWPRSRTCAPTGSRSRWASCATAGSSRASTSTEEGMALRERLVVARTEGLRELIDDWEPDRYPELDPVLRRLAAELAAPA